LSDWKRKVTAEYVPTADQRALVENAAAFGITQADIAECSRSTSAFAFSGLSSELDWALLEREKAPFGLTFVFTPQ
jgi:hypothetical protein